MKKVIMNEEQTQQAIINLARKQGVEEKVKKLINQTRNGIKNAKSEEERQAIAMMGLAEIHKTIGCVGSLVVDGVEIIPENNSYQKEIDWCKGVVKL